MTSFFRKIIGLTIVVLLAAAYVTMQQRRAADPDYVGTSQLESILVSISEKVPTLQEDIKQLGEEIKRRIPELALRASIGQSVMGQPEEKESLSASADVKEETESVQKEAEDDKMTDKIGPVIQLLKEKGAEDLALELEKLYRQSQKQVTSDK
ncbi:MAG: hypothetical protein C4527_26050 [Candidatus Omnitrophota bacterium]|jgi:hypothetical protein|nr:MAG: hypothetical protein C4527_26050 [Candidatus Omnitrophota bacterium]